MHFACSVIYGDTLHDCRNSLQTIQFNVEIKQKGFCCHTAIAAMIWPYDVLLSLPEFALHECVPKFDVHWHKQILEAYYSMASVVWCILLQGDPVRRRRRSTLWTRQDRIRLGVLYNLEELSRRYFRKLVLDGLVYFVLIHMNSKVSCRNSQMSSM